MCSKFGIIMIANNDLAMGGRDLWITLYFKYTCIIDKFIMYYCKHIIKYQTMGNKAGENVKMCCFYLKNMHDYMY